MKKKYLYILFAVLFAVSSIQLYSLDSIISRKFYHQYILILFHFIGEICSLILCYIIPKKKSQIFPDVKSQTYSEPEKENITTILGEFPSSTPQQQPFIGLRWYAFIFPTLGDLIAKLLIHNGIVYLKFQSMLTAIFVCIVVFFLSWCNYFKTFSPYSFIGFIIWLLGAIILIVAVNVYSELPKITKENFFGIFPIMIGEIFVLFQCKIQLKNVTDSFQEVASYEEVGYEGIFGTIFSFVIVVIAHFIPCDFFNDNLKKKICPEEGHLENVKEFFRDFSKSFSLGFTVVLFILCTPFDNLVGVNVMKKSSIFCRIMVDNGKIVSNIILRMIIEPKMTISVLYVTSIVLMVIGICFAIKLIKVPLKCEFFERMKAKPLLKRVRVSSVNVEVEENIINKND